MSEPQPRIDDLRRRVQNDPASIAFAQLGEEYRRAGAFDEAVVVCRAGLTRHPGYLSARVTLGRALIELGQLDDAHTELQTVLAGAPDNLAAIRGLGDIAYRRDAVTDALSHYRRALGLARNDPDLQQLVAELTRQVARVPRGVAVPAGHPSPRADQSGLLTLEQLTQELQQAAHREPMRRPPTVSAAASSATAGMTPDPQLEADRQTLTTLERWLTAVDGYRTEHRA